MKRLCYDIEANHYEFDKLHTIHCIAIGEVGSKNVSLHVTEEEKKEAIQILNEADVLVGHNLLRYDHTALKMFYPEFNPKNTHDTLIMSRLAKPKWRQHSLKIWGDVLGFKKGDYADRFKAEAGDSYETGQEWQSYNDDMGAYCIQDVRVNLAVYNRLLKAVDVMFSWENLELEQFTIEILEEQKKIGVGFNVQKAEELYYTLRDRREE